MNKCSPVVMRRNLMVVEEFKKHGIDFVAIAVKDELHKQELITYGNDILHDLTEEIEGLEC